MSIGNRDHVDTLKCYKRDGGPIYDSAGLMPIGYTGKPCKCKLWKEYPQAGDTSSNVPPRLVQACFFDAYLWVQSECIRKSNQAAAAASAMREEVQLLRQGVGTIVKLGLGLGMPQSRSWLLSQGSPLGTERQVLEVGCGTDIPAEVEVGDQASDGASLQAPEEFHLGSAGAECARGGEGDSCDGSRAEVESSDNDNGDSLAGGSHSVLPPYNPAPYA